MTALLNQLLICNAEDVLLPTDGSPVPKEAVDALWLAYRTGWTLAAASRQSTVQMILGVQNGAVVDYFLGGMFGSDSTNHTHAGRRLDAFNHAMRFNKINAQNTLVLTSDLDDVKAAREAGAGAIVVLAGQREDEDLIARVAAFRKAGAVVVTQNYTALPRKLERALQLTRQSAS